MSKPISGDKEVAATLLSSVHKAVSKIASLTRTDNPKRSFLRGDQCLDNVLFVPDADDVDIFQNHAAKVWRLAHPVKPGRHSLEPLVFKECLHLYETRKISEGLSLEKITDAVMDSFEDKKVKNLIKKIPYQKTVHKHVREWRKRTRELIKKGHGIKEIRNILLEVKPRRPYDPWASRWPSR